MMCNDTKFWDLYYCNLCNNVKLKSTCLRRQIGAVITKDNKFISSGYNGAPKGIISCKERGECLRDILNIPSGQNAEMCYAVHSEQLAIIKAIGTKVSIKDSTIYINTSPCSICVKLIIAAGINRIVICGEQYPDEFAVQLIEESDLVVDYVSNE